MSNFLEQTCTKTYISFYAHSFTKQSFAHEQSSSIAELFFHSVAIQDVVSHKFPILFMNEVIYYE